MQEPAYPLDALSGWALPPPAAQAAGEVEPIRAFDTAEAALAFLTAISALDAGSAACVIPV
jgi:hypothetical protein